MQVQTMWTIHIEERHDDEWLFYTEEFPILDLSAARLRYQQHKERLTEEEVLTEWALALTDDFGEAILETDKAMEGANMNDGCHEDRTIDHAAYQSDRNDRFTNKPHIVFLDGAEWLIDLVKRGDNE